MSLRMIDELAAVDRLQILPWPWPRDAADALLAKLPDLCDTEAAA